MVKAVIFDFDGTLTDSYKKLYEGIVTGMKRHSLLNEEQFSVWKKDFTFKFFWSELNWLTYEREAHERFGIHLSEEQLAGIHEKIEAVKDKFVEEINFYWDVNETIHELSKLGLSLGICSFSLEQRMVSKLREENLLGFFEEDLIFGREKALRRPRRMRLLLEALRKRGVMPSNCLYVGDMPSDVLAGRENGVGTFIVRRKIDGRYVIPKELFEEKDALPLKFLDNLDFVVGYAMEPTNFK